jgi:hypothetical protein
VIRKKTIRVKPALVNVVGSYAWAMAQVKNGQRVRRAAWDVLVIEPGEGHDFVDIRPEDKKALDWQIMHEVPVEAVVVKVEPELIEVKDPEYSNGYLVLAIIVVLAVIIGFMYIYPQQ